MKIHTKNKIKNMLVYSNIMIWYSLLVVMPILYPDILQLKNDYSVEVIKQAQAKTKPENKTVKERIIAIAEKNNFKYTDYLLRLAKCESQFDAKARNDNGDYGMDRGVFQVNNRYHPEVSDAQADDVEFAAQWTMDKINKGQQNLWACDKIIKNK